MRFYQIVLFACFSVAPFVSKSYAVDMQSEDMQQAIMQMRSEMQATIDKMQQEMDEKVNKMQRKMETMEASISQERQEYNDSVRAMESELKSERELMRDAAGGAPDALRSTNKSATVRIGGELAIRYYANFDDNYHQQGQPQPSGGEYATRLGWTMDTASITFDVDFNEDVSMFIDVRPNYFDKAYIQWNNIGGSGLGSQIGLIGIPGGMYSSSTDMWSRVFITDPVVKDFSQAFIVQNGDAAKNPGDDIKRMGLKLYYELFNEQLLITGTVFSPTDLGEAGDLLNGFDYDDPATILTPSGDPRNNGFVNNGLSFEFRPGAIEGLLLSATYVGVADFGQGTYTVENRRGASFNPMFDLGVAYLTDTYGVYFETAYNLNTKYYSDTYNYSFSLGADYKLFERFKIGGGVGYGYMESSNDLFKAAVEPNSYPNLPNFASSTVRLRLAARYDFANGIWMKAEYGHLISTAQGMNDNSTKSADHFCFETGLDF